MSHRGVLSSQLETCKGSQWKLDETDVVTLNRHSLVLSTIRKELGLFAYQACGTKSSLSDLLRRRSDHLALDGREGTTSEKQAAGRRGLLLRGDSVRVEDGKRLRIAV